MEPIVQKLNDLINENNWQDDFNKAIYKAQEYDIYNFPELKEWNDYNDYLNWLDMLVNWAPREKGDTRFVYDKITEFYFIVDQEPVKSLQSPVEPGASSKELTPLSQWIKEFAVSWGAYLDTDDSAKHVKSFKDDPLFNWNEYMPPPASYLNEEDKNENDWKAYRTFNQFFARHYKPGMRPIAGLRDDSVIVSPADCTFVGWWQISEKNEIYVEENKLDVKGIQWSIHELLKDSDYADAFKGGIFTHSFLNTFDYHRWHTPVEGKVLEAKIIQGQAYLDVNVVKKEVDGKLVNALNALDGTGYQFVQTRGLVVIDSPIGLVACLPMGMAQVSSVVLTAEEGVTIHKGEELGYFQFGGSDFVMVFERSSNVQLINQPNVHYQQGTWIGNAFPY